MAANTTLRSGIDAFRKLLKIGKSHRDMEPIQHVLSARRNVLMKGSQNQHRHR